VVLLYQGAFAVATIFHGLQYLAIVTIFHTRERLRQPGNRHGWLYQALVFYAMCVGLAWALFSVWPYAYVLLGFGLADVCTNVSFWKFQSVFGGMLVVNKAKFDALPADLKKSCDTAERCRGTVFGARSRRWRRT
jgi:hypothetical protein